MSALVSTVVAALSAFAALASLFLYLYFGRRSDLAAAREEALALAQTRGQVIRELRGQLGSLEERHKRGMADRDRRIHDLRAKLEKTRIACSTSMPQRSLTSSTICAATSSGPRPMSMRP
jgi:hypothetical protein